MAAARRFCVHILHDDHRQEALVQGRSFEDAALAFVERWHPAPDPHGDIAVIVREAESGREQCFRIDVGTGEAAPCD